MPRTLSPSPEAPAPVDPAALGADGSVVPRPQRSLVLFAAPAVLWYGVFTIGPLVAMFWISLLKWRSLIGRPRFAGLDNYAAVLTDDVFWEAVRNTAVQVGVSIPLMVPLSFMLGYFISLNPPGHRVLRVLLFIPALISLAAMGVMFLAVFGPNGLLNGALATLGLDGITTPWLANRSTALFAVIAVNLWSGVGFTAVLFAARLAAVSPELYQAAELDGCGHWRKMWQIAYPGVRDYFGVLTMLQFLWTLFNSAGLILLLTNGGPGSSTTTLSFLIYDRAFIQSDLGYSQAVGVLLFAVGLVGMLVIRRVFQEREA
ncbi:sugar ABC transporter permease [Actinomycetes bacterium KLBMP 9759]